MNEQPLSVWAVTIHAPRGPELVFNDDQTYLFSTQDKLDDFVSMYTKQADQQKPLTYTIELIQVDDTEIKQ